MVKAQRNFRLVAQDRVVPPWSQTLLVREGCQQLGRALHQDREGRGCSTQYTNLPWDLHSSNWYCVSSSELRYVQKHALGAEGEGVCSGSCAPSCSYAAVHHHHHHHRYNHQQQQHCVAGLVAAAPAGDRQHLLGPLQPRVQPQGQAQLLQRHLPAAEADAERLPDSGCNQLRRHFGEGLGWLTGC